MSSDSNSPTKPEGDAPQPEHNEGMNRRQFVIRLSAYGLTAVAASVGLARGVAHAQEVPPGEEVPMSGTIEATAEINTGKESSSYQFIGSLVYETYEDPKLRPGDWGMRILKFSLSGKRLSGPDLGPITLALEGPATGVTSADGTYAVGGPLVYTDRARGKLRTEAKWIGDINDETDEIKSLRLEAVTQATGSADRLAVVSVGIKIPIGKMTDDGDDEEM